MVSSYFILVEILVIPKLLKMLSSITLDIIKAIVN